MTEILRFLCSLRDKAVGFPSLWFLDQTKTQDYVRQRSVDERETDQLLRVLPNGFPNIERSSRGRGRDPD